MTPFTKNFQDFNREHPVVGDPTAGLLAEAFPEVAHVFGSENWTATAGEPAGDESGSKVIAFVPFGGPEENLASLESVFRELVDRHGALTAVDMDIAAPRSVLLGTENTEGLSDHFLYGVSPGKLLRESSAFPGLRVITPGTFTPRSAEVFADPRWSGLLEFLAGETPGPVILLTPPADRFATLSPLAHAGTVAALFQPENKEREERLLESLEKIRGQCAPECALQIIWLAGIEAEAALEPETPAGTPSPQEEPVEAATEQESAPAEELPPEPAAPPVPESDQEQPLSGETPEEKSALEAEQEPAGAVGEEIDDFLAADSGSLPPIREVERGGKTGESSGAEAAPGESAEEPEPEIFLPDELLFMEEEEAAAQDKTEKEKPSGQESEEIDLEKLPDLKAMSEVESPAGEAAGEHAPVETGPVMDSAPLEELSAKGQEEALQPAETAVEDAGEGAGQEEIDPDAFYRDEEPEEEEPVAAADSGPVDESRLGDALERMESFEEVLNNPPPEEHALDLDLDPLDQKPSEPEVETVEAEPAEAPEGAAPEPVEEPVELTAPAGETVEAEPAEAPEGAAPEPVEEPVESSAQEGETVEAEPAEAPEGALPEPVEEPVESAAQEGETGEAEPAEAPEGAAPEPVEEPVESTVPAGETGEAEPLEALDEIELEPVEALEGAGPEPVQGKTTEEAGIVPAEPDVVAAAETAKPAPELVELDDQGTPQEAAAVGEGAAADKTVSAGGGPEISQDDLEKMLEESDQISVGGEDFGLGVESEAVAAPVKVARKKAGSGLKYLITFIMLLFFLGGIIFVWRQGTVSYLVRQMPQLSGILGLSTTLLKDEVMKRGEGQSAEEAGQLAGTGAASDSAEMAALMAAKLDYSVQIGSYRFRSRAMDAQEQLAEKGMENVYVVPLELDSLGNWNRLYMGYFGSVAAADTALKKVSAVLNRAAGSSVAQSAIIRKTPYALWIDDYTSLDTLEKTRKVLTEHDIPSYLMTSRPDSLSKPVYRLFVGAFENEDQAFYLRTEIFNIGVRAKVVERSSRLRQGG